jgi:hypothetical protein
VITLDNTQHSDYSESKYNEFSLWVLVKNRYSGIVIARSEMNKMAKWLDAHSIPFECDHAAGWDHYKSRNKLLHADLFYLGIYPANEIEMNAVKIAWGELLTSRGSSCF